MDKIKLENFCKKFASYVTGNWRENHLHIYVNVIKDNPVEISCYGLGKVNFNSELEKDYPFYKDCIELIESFPENKDMLSVEFFCGRINSAKLEFSRDF